MTTTFRLLLKIIVLINLVFAVGCHSAKPIPFKSPVDTTTKPIVYQIKKVYNLESVGVFASNQFDGARLNGFEILNDSTAAVIINPENTPINNSPYYAFKTWSSAPKPFYFTFKYPKGFKHRYISKLKKDEKWFVIDSLNEFKKDSIVTIKLNLTETPQTISGQEIESSTDVKNWYTKLITGKEDVVKLKSNGKTILGRNLPMLDICKGNPKGKQIIVLLTRQHPPEVTGYYAFQSFLETILNGSELSNKFLNKFHILAFPIMNPDGVDLGHWRHNAGGVDMNRDWSVYNQPEIKQTIKAINKSVSKNRSELVLGIDFHSTWYDVFYTNKDRANTTLPDFVDNWFTALENNITNYKVNEQSANSDKPTSKGWFLNTHNAVGITFEIGDKTTYENIDLFGKVSAEQMMKILTKTIN
jgi:hypothetical protein